MSIERLYCWAVCCDSCDHDDDEIGATHFDSADEAIAAVLEKGWTVDGHGLVTCNDSCHAKATDTQTRHESSEVM